ncbi:ApaG domain [Candidatus Methylacidiphilum infernorum]|uniref:ApaG domain n=1 Tax=Candidatus Methylacidiphilum infernorum TaxID=511746 RepID=A0ABX7PX28_9BACT|nr:ApaG domain [Candidatus Methylacidiphilum infernorum]QSR87144.1 ApaG domain [Candidatus Methylacidiphilum infernorum]
MGQSLKKVDDVKVIIEHLEFERSKSLSSYYLYVCFYYISIVNSSPQTIILKGRKWIVTNDLGEKVVIEGMGIVGSYPKLRQGEKFRYSSHHFFSRPSVAEGAYFGINSENIPIVVPIPKFPLLIPP